MARLSEEEQNETINANHLRVTANSRWSRGAQSINKLPENTFKDKLKRDYSVEGKQTRIKLHGRCNARKILAKIDALFLMRFRTIFSTFFKVMARD